MAEPRRRTTRASSATPARMPAVQSKQSHAYGAKGKTTLQTQLTTTETSLEGVMDEPSAVSTATPSRNSRHSIGTRQTPDRSMRPPPSRSVRHSAQPTIEEESEARTPEGSFHIPDFPDSPTETKTTQTSFHIPNVSVLNRSASELITAEQADRDRTQLSEQRFYAQEAARQRIREQRARENRSRARPHDNQRMDSDQEEEVLAQAQPSRTRVFFTNVIEWLGVAILGVFTFAFFATTGILLIYGAASLLPWPSSLQPYALNVVNSGRSLAGLSLYDKAPKELEERWIRFQHDILFEPMLPEDVLPHKQYQVNLLLEFRLDRLEKRISAVEGAVGLHNETLKLLHNLLPSHIVVEEVDGETVIGEHFWHAFQQKMASDAGDPLWNLFLERNEQALTTLNHKAVVNALTEQHRSQKIISGEDLVTYMNEHYMRLKEEHTTELDKAEKAVLKEAKEAAQAMINDSPLAQISRLQTTALATHLTIENGLRELHSVNFLSKNLGAVANRQLSSPTARRPWKGFMHKAYIWWQGIQPFPHGPDMALDRWNDVSDAWCTPPSTDKGMLQLAVNMEHVVIPDKFTVEHMPRSGTLNIAAAPRDFDVWAEVESAAAAAQMELVVGAQRQAECGVAPGANYVCIGAGIYDIHATNWVQEIRLHAKTSEFDMPVKNIVFKVLNNWGGDYTCLYRVRMTGDRIV